MKEIILTFYPLGFGSTSLRCQQGLELKDEIVSKVDIQTCISFSLQRKS